MYEKTAVESCNVTLENRKRLTMSCVVSVDAFSEQSIRLTTADGKVIVTGEGLKVVGFSKQTGAFSAEGRVDAMRFSGAKTTLLKKVFR